VQALLKTPGQKLNLLPGGEVSLHKIDEETVQGKAGIRKLSLYAMSPFDAQVQGRIFVKARM